MYLSKQMYNVAHVSPTPMFLFDYNEVGAKSSQWRKFPAKSCTNDNTWAFLFFCIRDPLRGDISKKTVESGIENTIE